ncbi:hypothetical protein [Streptomyces sp. NPDC046939]|uniref:hypothetical protein n=1 Tax=Streptomyces sp. NPDC046939 TaxID=3155376 RepID=UPI0033C0FBC1
MFAAVCVTLASAGHVLMTGVPVPWPALVLAGVGTGLAGWAFAAAERRRRTVIVLTVTVQAGLHQAFALAQSLARPVSMPGATSARGPDWAQMLCGNPSPQEAARAYDLAVRAGLLHSTHLQAAAGDGAAMPHGMAGIPGMSGVHHLGGMTEGGTSWGMPAAHLLAALLCGVWLAQGERAAFRVLRSVADRAFVPLCLILAVCPACDVPSPIRRSSAPVARLRPQFLAHALTSRGPPGAPAVA